MNWKIFNLITVSSILTCPILTSLVSCGNSSGNVDFQGNDTVNAVLSEDKWFLEYEGFSFNNFKNNNPLEELKAAALATFSDEIETKIIHTQKNNFTVRLYIPNPSNFEHGQYRLSLVIYDKNATKTYFNKVLKFNINPEIIIPKSIPTLTFRYYQNYYWATCPGFTLRNFKNPYSYGFSIPYYSRELGSLKLEFEISSTDSSGDCNFAILFKSDAEFIDNTKRYIIVLNLPGYEHETITFEVNSDKLNFENDSWDNVIYYANKGFDFLKDHYSLSSFVGLTKEISVDHLRYHVRVIGENHDDVSGQAGVKACLTFQFCELISDNNGHSIKRPWSINANIWYQSQIREYLNDENGFLSLLPTSISNRIKKVIKSSAWISQGRLEPYQTSDLIWLPSNTEISQPSSKQYEGPYSFINEGSCYEYYATAGDPGTPSELRKKIDLFTQPQLYWTRTIEDPNVGQNLAFRVFPNGIIQPHSMTLDDTGFAPCFCI